MAKDRKPAGTPVVRNFDELFRAPVPKGDLLIHFTPQQWKRLTKGVRSTKAIPKRGMVFDFQPDPGGGGVGGCVCYPGPAEECLCKPRWTPGGVQFDCQCKQTTISPPGGGGGQGPRQLPPCIFVMPRRGAIRCLRGSCTSRCEVRSVSVGTRLLLYCACV